MYPEQPIPVNVEPTAVPASSIFGGDVFSYATNFGTDMPNAVSSPPPESESIPEQSAGVVAGIVTSVYYKVVCAFLLGYVAARGVTEMGEFTGSLRAQPGLTWAVRGMRNDLHADEARCNMDVAGDRAMLRHQLMSLETSLSFAELAFRNTDAREQTKEVREKIRELRLVLDEREQQVRKKIQ